MEMQYGRRIFFNCGYHTLTVDCVINIEYEYLKAVVMQHFGLVAELRPHFYIGREYHILTPEELQSCLLHDADDQMYFKLILDLGFMCKAPVDAEEGEVAIELQPEGEEEEVDNGLEDNDGSDSGYSDVEETD